MKKRILSILLTLCMLFCLVPTGVFAEGETATGSAAIQLGTDALSKNVNTATAPTVYFGQDHENNPAAWRVIGYNGNGVASAQGDMTLLAAGNMSSVLQFADFGTNNRYASSYLKTAIDALAEKLTTEENTAVKKRTLTSGSYNGENTDCVAGEQVDNAVFWPLSTAEAFAVNQDLRIVDPEHPSWASSYWWLRSPGYSDHDAATVNGDGSVVYSGNAISSWWCVRPAFNLNSSSVLFTSAAVGGKPDGGLTPISKYTGNEWKLTLKDSNRNFAVTETTVSGDPGDTVTLHYTGATAGINEYISVILADNSGAQYYGRVAQPTAENGTVEIKIPSGLAPGSYTLKVFSEQCNDDKKTDYASDFVDIDLTVGYQEQFTLTPGGVYYFDLSGVSIPGTANGSLPDKTMHYVPFTYAGTVDAYKLTSEMATTEEYAQQNEYAHSLFVADYAVTHAVSWDDLNATGLIFGKGYATGSVDYTLRAPSGGSGGTGSGALERGTPQSNEWDRILDKDDGYIKNWRDIDSWGQDTLPNTLSNRVIRGRYDLPRKYAGANTTLSFKFLGFRPVLEVLNPDTLDPAGLKAVTLDLGGGKLGGSSDTIQIIVKTGESFTAPASEGLTRPAGDTGSYFMWLGSDGELYEPGDNVSADVIKLTAQFAPPEQFNLVPGGRYYFDLSAMNIPGTANRDLPDSTLHYVPFTYVGTVDAYKLTSAMATTKEYAEQNKYPHSLFVADYAVTHAVSWNGLNDEGLIFGKNYASGGVDYTLRAPSVGSDATGLGDSDPGEPQSNEWDTMLNKDSGYIQNWNEMFSWGQDTVSFDALRRAVRGYDSARHWLHSYATSSYSNHGFRPVLEVRNPNTLGPDGLKAVTLALGGGKLGGSSDAIHIIVKTGSEFTAPASDGLNRPDGNTGSYFMWLGSDGKLYAPGASVPADVTKLTAQFALSEQFSLKPGGRYYFDLSGEDIPGTVNGNLPDSTLHYVPFTYAGTIEAYKLTSAMATTEEYAQQNKYAHSLFVADYAVTHTVSWDDLNDEGLIFGKNYAAGGVGYTLRAPSVGSDSTGSGDSRRGVPQSNEWDTMLNKDSGYIQNWNKMYSWGQDTKPSNSFPFRANRGYYTARSWNYDHATLQHPFVGFRPVLEVLSPDTLGSDGLKVVTLALNGGKLGGSSEAIQNIVKNGSAFTAPASDGLTRPDGNTGSYFMWLDSNGNSYAPGASVPADVTELTVQWTAPTYAVTLNTNGGTINNGNVTSYTYGVGATLPTDVTRTGYTFKGWYYNENLTGSPVTAISNTETGNKEYWAKWEINQYTVTVKPENGEADITITQDYGTAITAPANPTREGYTFMGWDKEIPATMPAENMTIKAQWEINQYMITFDTNGGSAIAPITQDYGTQISAPANPTREGYTFIGWDKAIPATMPAENVTITAQWEINQYTITFDTAGGSEIASITQDYGTAITAPSNPTREGYTFIGWDKAIPATMPAENITLKAKWKDIEKPTGEIIIGSNKWSEFLNELTSGLFFKDPQEVTINASDNSGIVFVSYLVTDQDLSEAELKSLVYRAYEEPFRIEPNGEYIVYVMLVDESLNITYLRSDRITLDNVLPVISGIEDGKTYCEAQTVTITEKYIDTVTVNGTAVTLDENGSFVLSPANGKQKIVVTDKAGNTAEMTVTVNDGHTLLADDNDCTTPVYCKFCNAEVIAAKSHSFTGNWQNDETAHWHICQNENCTVIDRKTAHSGEDDGNCLTAVVCECGYVITAAKPAHMFNEWTSNGNGTHNRKCTVVGCNCIETENCSGGKATCTEQAVCTVCHTGYGDTLGHNFTIAQHDETHHWNKCSRCDATYAKAVHTGGTATCREKAVCEVCRSAYGKLSATNHVGGTEIRNAKPQSCIENGYTGDTYCKGCGEKLSSGTVIHADGHKGGTATCTDKAECEVCHEKYGEPDANHHTGLETVDAVPATAASTGTAAHWRCTACGKLFADADGKREIRSEDTVTKKLAPSILDGANSEWRKGDENGLTFSSDAAFSDFVEVLVDGKTVASENYERQDSGIIVELKASYLETLAEGEHTLTIRSASGDATTRFTIAASDSTNAWVWIIIGFIALGIGVTVAVFVIRKRKTA